MVIIRLSITPSANRNTYSVAPLIIHIPRVEALRTSTLGYEIATPTELPGVRTIHLQAPSQPPPSGRSTTKPPQTLQEGTPVPWGWLGRGFLNGWGDASNKQLFFYRQRRTFFTAKGRFLYRRGGCRHARHDGGDSGDGKEENSFYDCRHRHPHQGEADSHSHGFLYLLHPLIDAINSG